MYVTMKQILDRANEENYCVAAPNVFNFETIKAVFQAAVEENSPLIIDINQFVFTKYTNGEYLPMIIRKMAEEVSIPVALNLDHGKDFDAIVKAIRAHFSSIMIDASEFSFDENVRRTKEAVKMAKAVGISVEAEIGHVGFGKEYTDSDPSKLFTDPKEAENFIELTGVDALAIAIGTAHGEYSGTPKIDFQRLKEIKDRCKLPLVLHGGSGTGDENLARAAKSGINKVNLFTDLRLESQKAIKKAQEDNPGIMLIDLEDISMNAFKEKTKFYMRLFGCSGKAW